MKLGTRMSGCQFRAKLGPGQAFRRRAILYISWGKAWSNRSIRRLYVQLRASLTGWIHFSPPVAQEGSDSLFVHCAILGSMTIGWGSLKIALT